MSILSKTLSKLRAKLRAKPRTKPRAKPLARPLMMIGVGALALTGCASMNEAECLTADWETVGYQDGAQGRPSDGISRHRKACAKHGVAPALATYLNGWEDGVLRYCTLQNGFAAGSSGRSYRGVCPADVEEDFLAGFADGSHLHHLQSDISKIETRLHRQQQRLETVEDSSTDKEADLIFAESTPEDRANLIDDLRQLAEEKDELTASLATLADDLGRAEAELEHFRSDITHEYGL